MTGQQRLERLGKVGKNFAKGFIISAAVGDWARGAKNLPEDVEAVQLLLDYAARKHSRNELSPRGIDGKISRIPGRSSTVKAIHAFQRTFMQSSDGLVEPEGRTLQMLREEVRVSSSVAGSAAKSVMQTPQGDGRPPWLHALNGLNVSQPVSLLPSTPSQKPEWISVAQEELGQEEIKGKEHNARILEYIASTTSNSKRDESPWCASFVNWVLTQAGYEGAGSAATHDWKRWGDGLSAPAVGCVAFIDWGKVYPDNPKKKNKGHVGFVVGKTAKNRIVFLGGNQSNQVRYAAFKESIIQAYRVPKGYKPTPEQFDLPMMEVSKDGGGFSGTR